jgi:dephospho-CoA kinase
MPVNDSLFQLIRSLTPGEKRYFKLYAGRQSEAQKTNYEKLFDEYNELPENEPYKEEEFLKKLKRKKLGKYFSDDKKHLTQLVLKAMRSYASEKKAEGRLADMIQEMNFLIEKGLMDHCDKICDKA